LSPFHALGVPRPTTLLFALHQPAEAIVIFHTVLLFG